LIREIEDVFYLSENELENILDLPDPKKIIKERQTEFSRYKLVEVPSRVTVPSPPLEQESPQEESGVLRGQGCYPGKISGEVVVIMDPGDDLDVNGKIICALRTDPGWAALFPTCKAVLIEKGSSLSHSVILLRELGIPSIINIPGLTKKMKNGDHISIDGETGEIFMENEETVINKI
jgi:rifampicin phosphotransferase